ncbi:beta-galactosidase [Streptomyces sp. NPDC058576]|uniref:beta-galactosidase n=1 Tax=Streptomyces sp. NPDC058576 TaxID=3346547 RepID=UPI0036570950
MTHHRPPGTVRPEEDTTVADPRTPHLMFGGDYNPEQWDESVWEEDVRLMGEAGITTVSLGIFAWAAIETSRGVYEFGRLDRVIDLLHAGGVEVCLATATASPPNWLVEAHPEVLPVDADGRRLGPGSRQHYCPSSPVYRERAAELTRRIARRYRDHPAVVMWHINNEYGCHVQQCFCDVSAADFRRWARMRYADDLDALNTAWTTTFWGQRYTGWEQIQPPRIAPTTLNPALLLDYRRFSSDALLDCFLTESDILRAEAPDIPRTTNFVGLLESLDQWKWAPHQDVVALDSYPDPTDPDAAARQALTFDLSRSLGAGRPWLLLEQAPSAVNWRDVNVPKPHGAMRLWSHQAVARGADGVMFFQFRQSLGGAEKWHSALLPHGGTDSRIWRETTRLGAELRELRQVAGTTSTADTAIVLDWNNWWALGLDARPSSRLDLPDLLLEHYLPLWEANIAVDFVGPGADLSRYRLVIVPHLYLVDDQDAQNLHRFAENGGHVLMSYFSGIVDGQDRTRPGGYPGAFRDLLGLTTEEFWPLPAGREQTLALADGRTGRATVWHEEVVPGTAKTLAAFADGPLAGSPAVTRNTYGLGSVTYLACTPDRTTFRALVHEAAAAASVTPLLPDVPPGVEVTLRSGGDGEALFLLNHNDRPVSVAVPAGAAALVGPSADDDGVVSLPPLGVAVLVTSP